MNIPMQAQTSVVDSFASILSQLFPFLILLIFIPPVYNTTYLMVQEKQTRIKESMRMMGMSDVPYWLSWFVWFLFVETVLVTLAFVIKEKRLVCKLRVEQTLHSSLVLIKACSLQDVSYVD